jgi:beta-lactamase superfamily II metal-dependent hydrolase
MAPDGGNVKALLLCLLAVPSTALAQEIKLHMLDVGQGDGLLLDCPDGSLAMVVDSADPREGDGGLKAWKATVKPRLDSASAIPLVIASHPYADHIGGLPWLLETYRAKVGLLVDNGRDYEGATYSAYTALRDALTVAHYDEATPWPTEVTLCDGKVKVTYWVADGISNSACKNDANLCSVFVRVDYDETSFLLTGDAHDKSELALLDDAGMVEWLDVDVLKVGHHGSYTSSDPIFLRAVSPLCAIISAGDPTLSTTNKRTRSASGRWSGYGHPRVQTLLNLNAELERHGQPMRAEQITAWNGSTNEWVLVPVREGLAVTARDGAIVVKSDGQHVTCR